MIPQELKNLTLIEQKLRALENIDTTFSNLLILNRRLMVEAHLLGNDVEMEEKKTLVLALEAKCDRLLALMEEKQTIEDVCELLGKITLYPDREF